MPYSLQKPVPEELLALPLSFSNYHKHKFMFLGEGVEEGDILFAFLGGQGSEVFDVAIEKDMATSISDLQAKYPSVTLDVFLKN